MDFSLHRTEALLLCLLILLNTILFLLHGVDLSRFQCSSSAKIISRELSMQMDHGHGELKSSSPCRSRNFRASAHFVIRSSNACLGPQVLERLSSGCRKCCADVWEIASHAKENTQCRCNPSLMGESANAARVVHAFVSRTSANDGCLFLLDPRASDSKPIKQKLVRIIVMPVQNLSSQPSPSLLQHILDGKKRKCCSRHNTL